MRRTAYEGGGVSRRAKGVESRVASRPLGRTAIGALAAIGVAIAAASGPAAARGDDG